MKTNVRAVLAEEVHRDGRIISPRDELVGAQLTVVKVHVRTAVDVAQTHLNAREYRKREGVGYW